MVLETTNKHQQQQQQQTTESRFWNRRDIAAVVGVSLIARWNEKEFIWVYVAGALRGTKKKNENCENPKPFRFAVKPRIKKIKIFLWLLMGVGPMRSTREQTWSERYRNKAVNRLAPIALLSALNERFATTPIVVIIIIINNHKQHYYFITYHSSKFASSDVYMFGVAFARDCLLLWFRVVRMWLG